MFDWIVERNSEGVEAQGRPAAAGLLSGTRVATPRGWTPVEELNAGDEVITFDHDVQELRSISRRLYPGRRDASAKPLVRVPAGLLGNDRPMMLMPGQGVIVESDLAEVTYGDPFALITAEGLADLPGVEQMMPDVAIVAVTLSFDRDEIVFADGQSLIHCYGDGAIDPADLQQAVIGTEGSYRMLDGAEARLLAADMIQSVGAARAS